MPPQYIDLDIRQRMHQLFIKGAYAFATLEVLVPWLVVVARGIAEGSQDTLEFMRILESNVFFH